MNLFKEMAPIYRPSAEEDLLATFIVDKTNAAINNVWKKRILWRFSDLPTIDGPDAIGNFVVRVPSTGRFRLRPRLPPVAIQAHMDMILAANDLLPGEDLKTRFKNRPIQLEEVGGYLQSVGQHTSIGADDTLGIAQMMRYVLDPTIEHPPLELVFTVEEEVGLRGAVAYDENLLPLYSPVMVNLDTSSGTKLVYGSQGAVRKSIVGTMAAEAVPAGTKVVEVKVANLLGGHSGLTIHLDRVNGVKAADVLLDHIQAQIPSATAVNIISGNILVQTTVSTGLTLQLAVPDTTDTDALRTDVTSFFASYVAGFSDETTAYTLTVNDIAAPADANILTAASEASIQNLIKNAPDRVVFFGDPGQDFPNNVRTSNNFGAVVTGIDPATPTSKPVNFGFMTRSFVDDEMQGLADQITTQIQGAYTTPPTITTHTNYPAWLTDTNHWFFQFAAGLESNGVPTLTDPQLSQSGLEPGIFMKKFPGMQAIAFGYDRLDIHTVRERITLATFPAVITALDKLLFDITREREFVGSRCPWNR